MSEKKKKKKEKEKITYIDDGRSLSDLSGLGGRRLSKTPSPSTWKARWETYKAAVKMMFLPMCVVVVGLVVLYLILTILFWIM